VIETEARKVQKLVLRLQDMGHSPVEISKLLGEKVSARTIYRWAKGEHSPQQGGNIRALERLLESPK
jgi:hypothetical protein